jgi:DNA primase
LGRIPDEIIQNVRDRVDVVELVGRTVALKRAGRSYKGLCPFHDEKTPSFNVNPDRQSFYCFGCHEGGDVFSFLMKTESLTFAEAVRSLAHDCGIAVPESGAAAGEGLAERIHAANAALLERYRDDLAKPGNPGAAYLEARGVDADTARRFKIGFAPDAWDTAVSALRAARIPVEVGERAGLVAPRESGGHYDRLRGRVVFPIEDARGRVLGFGGRAIAAGQEPKYLNTPESPVFRKREAMYGLPVALEPIRRSGRVVVVEGYFDQIALCRAGVGEALATCGTALTPDHARGLRRRTQTVVLLFDGDAAGERAMLRALEVLLPAGLRVHAAMLPEGDDPDSLLLREGGDALRALVDAAPAALDVALARAVAAGRRRGRRRTRWRAWRRSSRWSAPRSSARSTAPGSRWRSAPRRATWRRRSRPACAARMPAMQCRYRPARAAPRSATSRSSRAAWSSTPGSARACRRKRSGSSSRADRSRS